MNPFLTGGDMINEVSIKKSSWNSLPWKFEAGTPNIADGIAFSTALKYLKKIGMNEIFEHEKLLLNYAMRELKEINNLEVYGLEKNKLGIISFNIKGVHPHDLASILDLKGICVRSGSHCAQPLMNELKTQGTARASFYIYNDKKDVDALISGLKEVKKIFSIE